MVSRVYTPIIAPYNRPAKARNGEAQQGAISSDEESRQRQSAFQVPRGARQTSPAVAQNAAPITTMANPVQSEASSAQQRANTVGLQAVQVDRFRKIPLDAVLHDFNSTMDALGADSQTRAEVNTYLNVVSLQGGKEKPEIPFIKHTLKTAAGALDQYIAKALGQPSQVVREWVDALLMQDIDFHTQTPFQPNAAGGTIAGGAASIAGDTATAKEGAALLSGPSKESADSRPALGSEQTNAMAIPADGLGAAEKTRLKTLIDQARVDQQAGQFNKAQAGLQSALDMLDGRNQPATEGKIWHLRGRIEDKGGNWQSAVSAYEQAADCFQVAGRTDKQSQTLQAAASLLEDHGQLDRAVGYYRQVVALDETTAAQTGDRTLLARSLNDLGAAKLRQGNTTEAVNTLYRAATEAAATSVSPSSVKTAGTQAGLTASSRATSALLGDIYGNLAAAQRTAKDYSGATQSYRAALSAARTLRDKPRYRSTLQQLAATYAESGQPDQAMKALKRLESL